MATISKFYFHDATTPNTGTMPTGDSIITKLGTGTDAAGAQTARDATDVIGVSSPDTDATITAQAAASTQRLFYRRYVSRPLAAQTITGTANTWTFSYACAQSNTSHGQQVHCRVYLWRPSTGARVGTFSINLVGSLLGATTETAESISTHAGQTSQAILDGDIILFEITDEFTQSMAVAYTSFFSYDGITEASATTNAAFVTPPSALTLFTAAATSLIVQRRIPNRNRLLTR